MIIMKIESLPVVEAVKEYYGAVDSIKLVVPITIISDDESEYISCRGHHGHWYKRHRRNCYHLGEWLRRCMTMVDVDGKQIPLCYFPVCDTKVEHMLGLPSTEEELLASKVSHRINREWHLGQISANNGRYAEARKRS